MDPLTLILIIVVVLLLAGALGGRTYLPANGGSILYAICFVLVVFLLLRLLHVV